jgi:7,8-dihydropterin-6-yl-methyl-4-(beta-D-ribofuranosyl)aminobenzene 5'-phosphate synthase
MRSGHVVWPGDIRRRDDVPEDMAMVFDTTEGLVVLAGCGHAGLINTLEQARVAVRPGAKVHAVIGGLHLASMDTEKLDWTGDKLREFGLEYLHGAHCTGIAPVYHLRDVVGLPREAAHVGAVGASFELKQGINPLWIAR